MAKRAPDDEGIDGRREGNEVIPQKREKGTPQRGAEPDRLQSGGNNIAALHHSLSGLRRGGRVSRGEVKLCLLCNCLFVTSSHSGTACLPASPPACLTCITLNDLRPRLISRSEFSARHISSPVQLNSPWLSPYPAPPPTHPCIDPPNPTCPNPLHVACIC